ncbi:serine carboxypeptidase-like 13 [Lactuca sativa]|uniref:serine carboxypeptidase-like 13 n=1 Tax=Lactuca sativa TaxID=4236 RepID=UPI0022AED9BF|nr:serine carboxypeptidase-like 13 [Lactuca sativa]
MKPLTRSQLQSSNLCQNVGCRILLVLIIIVVSLDFTKSRALVKSLPGFNDDLPFTLETGYIGVGEYNAVQLFYYFVESEANPKRDPLMIWLTGGPGSSVLSAIIYEIGPFTFNYKNSTMEKQTLEINPYSWTKAANIIFLDQPAGAGFSYAKTPDAYITNDTFATMHAYQFIRKWFVDHPTFQNNQFYVGADSYAGIIAPMIVHEIYNVLNGDEHLIRVLSFEIISANFKTEIETDGYVLGNPGTDTLGEINSRVQYAHHMALLSDALYKRTKKDCHGEYLNIDPNNTPCINDLQDFHKCIDNISTAHILEPICDPSIYDLFRSFKSIEKASLNFWSLHQVQKSWCRDCNYLLIEPWANSKEVREALHIRKEFDDIEWVLWNVSLIFFIDQKPISYTHNVMNNIAYHQRLVHKKCRALVYSGDHDTTVPYLSTLNWIKSLNLSIIDGWRPWFVEEQIVGYTVKYSNHRYNLVFSTIKGAGHTAPEYKPKESLNMFTKWLSNEVL